MSWRPGAGVWRARRLADGVDVVIKVLPRSQADAQAARDLRRRARLLQLLDPPHAAPVLEAAEMGDHLLVVSGLARGEELGRRINRAGPWSPRRAVELIAQIADCLDAIHRAGMVHGSLNPRNVRIERSEPSESGERGERRETATVLDLGLPRSPRVRGRHEAEQIALWPAEQGHWAPVEVFAAPELLAGEPPTAASDVYSLAALLRFMLTGTAELPPPDAATIRVDPLRRSSEGRRVLALAAHGMAASPEQRPLGAVAFADAAAMALDPASRTRGSLEASEGSGTRPQVTVLPVPGPSAAPSRAMAAALPRALRSAAVERASVIAAFAAVLITTAFVVATSWSPWTSLPGAPAATPTAAVHHEAAGPGTAPRQHRGAPEPSPEAEAPDPPTPSRLALRAGLSGPPVAAVQWLLLADGSTSLPDGIYDAATLADISDFQVSVGLPVSGEADEATRRALVAPVALGDRGPRVRALQVLLGAERIDGVYGTETESTVLAFQRGAGLRPTGVVDGDTWEELFRTWL